MKAHKLLLIILFTAVSCISNTRKEEKISYKYYSYNLQGDKVKIIPTSEHSLKEATQNAKTPDEFKGLNINSLKFSKNQFFLEKKVEDNCYYLHHISPHNIYVLDAMYLSIDFHKKTSFEMAFVGILCKQEQDYIFYFEQDNMGLTPKKTSVFQNIRDMRILNRFPKESDHFNREEYQKAMIRKLESLPMIQSKTKIDRLPEEKFDIEILDLLGTGSEASVYKVRMKEKSHVKTYAVKSFHKAGKQPEFTFEKGHPFFLKTHAISADGRIHIMELGTNNLGELFTSGALRGRTGRSKRGQLFHDLFLAINYLHKRNFVHWDLKPENIVQGFDKKRIKVIDIDGVGRPTSQYQFGSSRYESPERILWSSDNPTQLDQSSDIYSLGIMLGEALYGRGSLEKIAKNCCGLDLEQADEPEEFVLNYQKLKSYSDNKPRDKELSLMVKMLHPDPQRRIHIDDARSQWREIHRIKSRAKKDAELLEKILDEVPKNL